MALGFMSFDRFCVLQLVSGVEGFGIATLDVGFR